MVEDRFKIKHLYAYVMTSDDGFAPNYGLEYNPETHEYSNDFRLCTLACCKPDLRLNIFNCVKNALKNNDNYDFDPEKINENDYQHIKNKLLELNIWIMGIAGKVLSSIKQTQIKMPIYIMQVNEILTFEDYYKKYKFKRNNDAWIYNYKDKEYSRFDNFYTNSNLCEQRERYAKFGKEYKFHHTEDDIKSDLRGKYVLCSDNYYYINAIDNFNDPENSYKYNSIINNNFKLFYNGKGKRFRYPPSISEYDSEENTNILSFFSDRIKNEWRCFYRKTSNES